MDKNKNNKIIGLSIGILIVLIIVVSSTYAYWQITRTQESPNNIVAACLSLELDDASTENTGINLDSAWPISDEEGKELTGYSFTVTNNCSDAVNYIVGLNSIEISDNTTYLNYGSIKVQLDNHTPKIYGNLNDIEYVKPSEDTSVIRDSKQLGIKSLEGNSSNTHTLRIWIDEDAPVSETNKSFSGKVFITGGQGVEVSPYEKCYTIADNGTILSYDYSCGTEAVVPAEVNGIEVKRIDYGSFSDGQAVRIEAVSAVDNNVIEEEYIFIKDSAYEAEAYQNLYDIYCDGSVCNLEDWGLIVISGIDEYNAVDWSQYGKYYIYSNLYLADEYEQSFLNLEYKITSLDLSNAIYLENIEELSFSSTNGSIQKLYLPQNGVLKTIGNLSFENNQLTDLVIPSSVQTIGAGAFKANQIASLTFEDTEENPSELTAIKNLAFENNALEKIVIPSSVTSIGSSAFADNANLTEVIIKNIEGAVTIEENVFPDTATITYNPDYTE